MLNPAFDAWEARDEEVAVIDRWLLCLKVLLFDGC